MMSKKKPKSINKPVPILSANKTALDSENDVQFELELCWCVQQLKAALDSGKLNQKVAEDTAKNIKILTSNTAPLIKKRQTMKLSMGDYRSKMQQEEKKMALASKQIKFTAAKEQNSKCNFVKKSAFLTSGKDFRFDFAVPEKENNSNSTSTTIPNNSSSLSKSISSTTTNAPFKFNFTIEEDGDNIDMTGLNIKG